MGVYVCTMRKATIEVGGVKIGNYKFAYKSWGYRDPPASAARAIASMEAAADRAKAANEGVELFTYGDLKPSENYGGVPVYRLPIPAASVYDSAFDREPVGLLVKRGRAWAYVAKEAQA